MNIIGRYFTVFSSSCAPVTGQLSHCTNVITYTAYLLARQWRKPNKPCEELSPRVFRISSDSSTFGNYYDEVQELLKSMAGMDELLPGMLVLLQI